MAFDPSLLTSLENLETAGLYAALTRAYHFARIACRYLPFARVNTDDVVRSRLYPSSPRSAKMKAGVCPSAPPASAGAGTGVSNLLPIPRAWTSMERGYRSWMRCIRRIRRICACREMLRR